MDFLGNTSPANAIQSVTNGVQSTGEALWPFLTFVGIGAAFFIAFQLIMIIKDSVQSDKSRKILGFYVNEVPYKGYNRWRSEDWNRRNTM